MGEVLCLPDKGCFIRVLTELTLGEGGFVCTIEGPKGKVKTRSWRTNRIILAYLVEPKGEDRHLCLDVAQAFSEMSSP